MSSSVETGMIFVTGTPQQAGLGEAHLCLPVSVLFALFCFWVRLCVSLVDFGCLVVWLMVCLLVCFVWLVLWFVFFVLCSG